MIEPQRILTLHLAGFLTMSLAWLYPAPSLGSQSIWVPPVVGSELVNSYRAPEKPYGAGHRGVDYEVALGQGVFAPTDATVSFVGKVVDRQIVSLTHVGNLVSSYEPVCSSLMVGEVVTAGEMIAEVCEPNQEYIPHCNSKLCLHFSVRRNGEYLSPLWFTGELLPSVLLPWVDPS